MNSASHVWCVTPDASGGWSPVLELAQLAARLWQTTPRYIHPTAPFGKLRQLASMAPRVRGEKPALLIIVSNPGDLLALADRRVLFGRFSRVGAWIIDSFWDDLIPRFARQTRNIDHLWITDHELLDHYRSTTGTPCDWAPWGTDALRLTRLPAVERDLDVLRLGRQPTLLDDDDAVRSALGEFGLSYEGRFPIQPTWQANQHAVHSRLARAKVVLASGNAASPAAYTHPRRDYISARFTDAIASGTPIAGQPPDCEAARRLLPERGLVWLDLDSPTATIAALRAAVAEWTPELARALQDHALREMDWRHRLGQISAALAVTTPTLQREQQQLDDAVHGDRSEQNRNGS